MEAWYAGVFVWTFVVTYLLVRWAGKQGKK